MLEHPHDYCCYALANQIKGNYTPIPEGATVGDIMKIMFPKAEIKEGINSINTERMVYLTISTTRSYMTLPFTAEIWCSSLLDIIGEE